MDFLSEPPRVDADPEHSMEGVEAVFFEGVPWKGKPTRIFAYYGIPTTQPSEQVPAMVLVHGGGGSAFITWVKLWVSRGYAAIAMDTCGCIRFLAEILPPARRLTNFVAACAHEAWTWRTG
jgi:cephalosporin-C deacetylase-like acetyl esterase